MVEGKIKKQTNELPRKLNLIWQTGESDFLRIQSKLETITNCKSSNNNSLFYINNKNFELGISLHKFIDKMDYAYKAADLVISQVRSNCSGRDMLFIDSQYTDTITFCNR